MISYQLKQDYTVSKLYGRKIQIVAFPRSFYLENLTP